MEDKITIDNYGNIVRKTQGFSSNILSNVIADFIVLTPTISLLLVMRRKIYGS